MEALPESNVLLNRVPLPEPVDEIRYERESEIESMILRAGRWFVKWPYTITDCFSVGYHRRGLFRPAVAVRYLDDEKLEAKRREMFGHAYGELTRALREADAQPNQADTCALLRVEGRK